MEPMNELKPGKLARPMDRNALSNDMGVLRNLLGMLNNPLVTGAAAPKEDAVAESPNLESPPPEPPAPPPPAPLPMTTPKPTAPAPAPAPLSPFRLPPGCRKIFLTGAAKSGKNWLAANAGARIMELNDPIAGMIRDVFPDAREAESLSREIFAWGDGLVTAKYPLTASRMHFVASVRMMSNQQGLFGIDLREFGTAGFWGRSLVARVQLFHADFPNELVVITDVWEPTQYSALRDAGFAPFHVMCNNITRSGRGGVASVSPLVNGIERDITNKISQQPRGKKLWAVWCDPQYPPTSGRMLTVPEFLSGLA
jgi:hypothetical protein